PLSRLMATKAPADDIKAALAELDTRSRAIEERIAQIQQGSHVVSVGPERRRLEIEGEPADLVKLDEELALLRAERSAIPTKHEELRKRLAEAEGEEAARALPTHLKALPEILRRFEQAQ